MQGRKFLWLLAVLQGLAVILTAQPGSGNPVLRENERGEQIIVYPDGRWQYFHRYSQGDRTLFDPAAVPAEAPREELNRYPVFSGKVLPFETTVPVTEEDAQKIAFRKAQLAQSAVAIADERASEARLQRLQLEEELAEARRLNRHEDDLPGLELRLQAARRTEEATAREALQAKKESARAESWVARGNYLTELKADLLRPAPPSGAAQWLTGRFYDNLAVIEQNLPPSFYAGSPMIHPPAPACRLAYDGIDEFTGMNRRDIEKQLLFSHTDERLRLYLKEKDYLRCEGFMTSLAGGYRYLSLEFTFAYPNAREAYGFIEKGSYLVVKLLDGQAVYLQSGKMDTGSYDTERELLTYQVHYPINLSVINTLRRGEVDTIRMYWSSGFEEYEVYSLDFFINQIRCLEQGPEERK